MKARKYSYYYVQKDDVFGTRSSGTAEPTADPSGTTSTSPLEPNVISTTFYGFRLQETFLENETLYTKLGFTKKNGVEAFRKTAPYPVKEIVFSQANVGARASFIRYITCEIKPVVEDETVAVFEKAYSCRLVVSSSLSDEEVGGALYGHTFNFQKDEKKVKYEVTKNSIKEVRRKNNARTIIAS